MWSHADPHFLELPVLSDERRLWAFTKLRNPNPRRAAQWWTCIREMRELALELIAPRVVFNFFPLCLRDGQLYIGDHRPLGITVSKRWQSAELIALFGLTLGGDLEKRSSDFFARGDYLKGYLLDLLGTCALVELQSRALREAADTVLANGYNRGPGLQPGSRSWSLDDQHLFFELLPLEQLGMKLLGSLSSSPAKSKTFGCGFCREG